MSASGEPPADEDPDTEPPMIEDEEMPTYVSLSSITSSSKLDESRAELEAQRIPEASEAREAVGPVAQFDADDQGGDCVYVSSGDETERVPFDDDDMEDYESDEMDLDEEEAEDEEDEDEENDLHPDINGEEDSDAETELFERSSDDFEIRHDSSLEKQHKPRSRSLQDLLVGKRRSVDVTDNHGTEFSMANPLGSEPNCQDPLGDVRKPPRSRRYAAVPSKVKLYIQEMKENNRRAQEYRNNRETRTAKGQEELSGILNLRSVTYEEYTNGDRAAESAIEKEEITRPIVEEKNGVIEYMEEQEVIGTTETETASVPTSLKTGTAKIANTVAEEARDVRENSDFPKSATHEPVASNRDSTDVAMLWAMFNQKTAQLNEKTAQYDGIRDAFQKTLSENISLKREMDELRRTVAKFRKENEPREVKEASVQTETVPEIVEPTIPIQESKAALPKVLSTSVGSAFSSIEQWSDSNCSPAISINPPNMDHVLNSDDSLNGTGITPRKPIRRMSQSFLTSSRILQTLANITQGRTRAAKYLEKTTDTRLDQGQSNKESTSPLVAITEERKNGRSKKRKASDMIGPSEGDRSFKIPYVPGEPRRKVNSDFETDAASKPRNVPTAGGSNDESSEHLPDDSEDNGATDVPDNVKCYVYQEEKDSKERSFLIQAEDVPQDSPVEGRGGTVRECGPYLLGNVEIRMTEANGTINIWGKEVSQLTEDLTTDEPMDESEPHNQPSTSRRPSEDSQRTPRCKFANGSPFVCSTNKKPRESSQFTKAGISKYFRPAFANLSRATSNLVDDGQPGYYRSSPILNNQTYNCGHCDSHKKPQRYNWPSCEFAANSPRKPQHSCCVHDVKVDDRECDCIRGHDYDVFDDDDDDAVYESSPNVLTSHKRCGASCHNVSTRNHCTEGIRRRQTSHNHHSPDIEADCHHAKKRRSSCTGDTPSYNQRLTPGNVPCCDNRNRSSSCHESCNDEEHPLIPNGPHYEAPETKRRRLSGKKVRGILTDLLRGCGGCRDHGSVSFGGQDSSRLQNTNPSTRVTSAAPSDLPNQNGCGKCARRAEMTAEIESKLEILTVEMERLRSRSDTFRGMLDVLNSETD